MLHRAAARAAILITAAAVLFGGTATLASAAAAKRTPVDAAFAHLRTSLETAHGLTKRERLSMLRTAGRAKAQHAHRRPCISIRTLELLRERIVRTKAHVGGLTRVELAIVRAAPRSDCARTTRKVTIQRAIIVGGPIKPLPRAHVAPEQDELQAPGRVQGQFGINAGPATTVVPAAAPVESSAIRFSTLSDLNGPIDTQQIQEPSEASAGKVVWYTHNSGAAYSLDGGKTFTSVDPRQMFPEAGHPWCCDQQVVYAPQINRFIWYAQYWCEVPDHRCDHKPARENYVRILAASPQAIAAAPPDDPGAAWEDWLITPRDVGLKHQWLDFPDLAVGRHSLYFTTNTFKSGNVGSVLSVIARIPLSQLKRGRDLSMSYYLDHETNSYRIAQGAGTHAYFGVNQDPRELFTLSWDEASPLLFPHHTRHAVSAFTDRASQAAGLNWSFRTDARITAATRRGDQLWFAWSEGRSICRTHCNDGQQPQLEQVWPQPHVHVVVVDRRSFRLVRDRFIHNPDFAIAFPSLATDSLGRVGMTFSYGGGTAGNPSAAAGYLTGGEAFRQVAPSPASGAQGDYFSLRPDWPDGSRLTASGFIFTDTGNGANPHWLFYRYSR